MGKAKELADFGGVVTVDSGNVGIGTATPTQSWTGGSAKVQQLQGGSSQITVLRVNESSGTYGDLQLISSGSAETGVYNFANGAMRFGTNGTERMRITSAGVVELAQGQLKFPATQSASSDANTLDDYEEGTWTPSIGGTATYSPAQGSYTKVGKLVTWQCTLYVATKGTGSANTISGFPFTVSGSNMFGCYFSYFGGLAVSVNYLTGYISGGGTSLLIVGTTSTTNAVATQNVIQNASYLEMSGFYYAS